MTDKLGLRSRIHYFLYRAKNLDFASVMRRARAAAKKHNKFAPAVLVDMLWSSAVHDTGFQDYVDWDFAILTRAERGTYVTAAICNHIAEKYNDAQYRRLFEDKIEFNKTFAAYITRGWVDVRKTSTEDLRTFVEKAGRVMGKVPVSNSGYGVEKYSSGDVADWDAFKSELLTKGQFLVEEYISDQHSALNAVCPGVVNTTRVTTFFDGETVHVLSFAQKFGVGDSASDQQTFGGFFTLLDLEGKSLGPGYGSHQNIYRNHPETGASIVDFVLPRAADVIQMAKDASMVVPGIQYVGWDIVLCESGPVLLEGNWMAGAYENKLTATGVRGGSLPLFREVIGF
jgi:glutathione synthase/RimK-type ligase-like ATP-grasp enzyme